MSAKPRSANAVGDEGFELSPWSQVNRHRWVRTDNAVVLFDHGSQGSTTKPWLPHTRGWKAFGPGPDTYNFLHYFKWRRLKAPSKVARKWRSPEAAMAAVDSEYPLSNDVHCSISAQAELDREDNPQAVLSISV